MISSDDAKQLALKHLTEKLTKEDPAASTRVTVLEGWPETSYRTSNEPVWTVWISEGHHVGGSRCIVVSQHGGKVLMDARVGE